MLGKLGRLIIFESTETEVVDFSMSVPAKRYKVLLEGVEVEKGKELNIWEQCYVNMKRWKEK